MKKSKEGALLRYLFLHKVTQTKLVPLNIGIWGSTLHRTRQKAV